jgi:hypothetical protein
VKQHSNEKNKKDLTTEVGRVVQAGSRMHRIKHQYLMRIWSNEKKLICKRKGRESNLYASLLTLALT